MYPKNSKRELEKDDGEEDKDFWYIDFHGEKVKVSREGKGTVVHFGGPAGDLYLDEHGNS